MLSTFKHALARLKRGNKKKGGEWRCRKSGKITKVPRRDVFLMKYGLSVGV